MSQPFFWSGPVGIQVTNSSPLNFLQEFKTNGGSGLLCLLISAVVPGLEAGTGLSVPMIASAN